MAGGVPQTQIELGYISSGHCCFSLRRKAGGGPGDIEAVVKDTSRCATPVGVPGGCVVRVLGFVGPESGPDRGIRLPKSKTLSRAGRIGRDALW